MIFDNLTFRDLPAGFRSQQLCSKTERKEVGLATVTPMISRFCV